MGLPLWVMKNVSWLPWAPNPAHSITSAGCGRCLYIENIYIIWINNFTENSYIYPTFHILKNESTLVRSQCSLCVWISYQLLNTWTYLYETFYICEPIITCVYPSIVARQRVGRNVTTAMNTHATVEKFLDTSFYRRPVLYQKNEGCSSQNLFFSEIQ
jgi:hypothetical protein